MLLMKKYKQLTSEQRYAIYLGLENGDTQRTIASLIGVSPSAVSRELQRNKDKRGGYSWRLAHEMAMERRERLPGNRATPEWIKQKVIRLVRKDWSPGQISGHLRKKENIRVSHETIYKWIREDKKAGGDLYKHCRHRLKHRKRPVGSVRGIPNRRSIRERPVEADGKRFGDFEMDTMIGADQSEAILTVTERKTNLVMIGELPRGRDSKGLAYSYNDRYFTEFNFGYNGSENFKKGYRFGFFPSVALGWVISNESFMQGMNPMHSPICGYQPRKYVNPNDDARSGYSSTRPLPLLPSASSSPAAPWTSPVQEYVNPGLPITTPDEEGFVSRSGERNGGTSLVRQPGTPFLHLGNNQWIHPLPPRKWASSISTMRRR
jgi:transposase